jgi:hypothetical protein
MLLRIWGLSRRLVERAVLRRFRRVLALSALLALTGVVVVVVVVVRIKALLVVVVLGRVIQAVLGVEEVLLLVRRGLEVPMGVLAVMVMVILLAVGQETLEALELVSVELVREGC